MTLRFYCIHCGRKLRAPDGAAGKRATCTKCGNAVEIPECQDPEEADVDETEHVAEASDGPGTKNVAQEDGCEGGGLAQWAGLVLVVIYICGKLTSIGCPPALIAVPVIAVVLLFLSNPASFSNADIIPKVLLILLGVAVLIEIFS